jgi:hypothetical protein
MRSTRCAGSPGSGDHLSHGSSQSCVHRPGASLARHDQAKTPRRGPRPTPPSNSRPTRSWRATTSTRSSTSTTRTRRPTSSPATWSGMATASAISPARRIWPACRGAGGQRRSRPARSGTSPSGPAGRPADRRAAAGCRTGERDCLGCHFFSAGRRRARRSSSVVPPHTPEVIPWSIAQARHAACAGQDRQIRLASSIWRSAGPIVPTGKKRSASASRQAASSCQSVRMVIVRPSAWRGGPRPGSGEIRSASRTPFRPLRQPQTQHGEGASSCSCDFANHSPP